MASPRRKRKGESDLSYALAMLNFHRFSDRIYGGGRKSRYQTDAEKRVLDLGGKLPPPKKRRPRRLFRDTLLEAQRNAAKLASDQFNKKSAEQVKQFYDSLPKQPKSNLSMQEQIDRQNKLYQQYLKDKKIIAAPRKGPVQRMPQKPSTLGKIFKDASTKPEGGFMSNILASGIGAKPSKFNIPVKQVKPLPKRSSPTSQYRGGSGKYNQAAYLAGFGMNPNIRKNQGIYKPYANGGGVRKPKYKE